MIEKKHLDPADEAMFADDALSDEDDMFDITRDASTGLDENSITVPGYSIIKEVGKGAMSTVLLAERENSDFPVVLKVFLAKGMEDADELRRFLQEYDIISSIKHPHVIEIYERAFASDFAYIAMEYLPGGSLRQKIKRGITVDLALDYLTQIASGLSAVHERDIVHRDLKPGNILLKNDGGLAITDFGVSKVLSDSFYDMSLTRGFLVGTPYYMSPEQGLGQQVDIRSDIYSLGILFFEMLTSKRPYEARTIEKLVAMHNSESLPGLPPELSKYQRLLNGMLEKKPEERFQNAGELLDGIQWIKKS